MERKTGKKVWSKPQLIVLVRNHPEEAVLEHCKQSSVGFHGPGDSVHQGCADYIDTNCTNCHSRGGKGS